MIEKKKAKLRIEDVAYCAVIVWTWGAVALIVFVMGLSLFRMV